MKYIINVLFMNYYSEYLKKCNIINNIDDNNLLCSDVNDNYKTYIDKVSKKIISENTQNITNKKNKESKINSQIYQENADNYKIAPKEHVSIKKWDKNSRPREKLLMQGPDSLTDAELIAILIGSGTGKQTAVDLARTILKDCDNNLMQLARMSVGMLKNNYKGIGEAKAVSIVAALELGRRRRKLDASEIVKIKNSQDVYEIMHYFLSDISYEEFWVILLDRSSNVIVKKRVSKGGVSGALVDVRNILKLAIDFLASSIVLCHNHPSGNKNPSKQDILLTKKIKDAASLMDILVLDHIIIAKNNYYSFADDGRI